MLTLLSVDLCSVDFREFFCVFLTLQYMSDIAIRLDFIYYCLTFPKIEMCLCVFLVCENVVFIPQLSCSSDHL